MLLRTVVDIDPQDIRFQDLSNLAFYYGLIDMTEVRMTADENLKANGQKVMFIMTEDTYQVTVRILLACAILNFASWKHEKFEIPLPATTNERLAQKFFRSVTSEKHREYGEKYLIQAVEIINKFSQPDGGSHAT